MDLENKHYKSCLRTAKILVKEADDVDLAVELLITAYEKFAGYAPENDPHGVGLAKHVHSTLLELKVSPDRAWQAAGLDKLMRSQA
jgi:hypothetical protein